jgi:hypothetical protein
MSHLLPRMQDNSRSTSPPPQHRRQRLVLRRRRDRALARQVIQRRDLRRSHLRRMALPGEVDKAPDPVHIRLLRPLAVMQPPHRIAHLVKQSRRLRRGGVSTRFVHRSAATAIGIAGEPLRA